MNYKSLLDKAAKAYYAGTPIMSDELFDTLSSLADYNQVGYPLKKGVPHAVPMASLAKIYPAKGQSLPAIFESNARVTSPKLDGSAISLLYVDGELTLGLTRGDGVRGENITEKVRAWQEIPNTISRLKPIQITGEVVAKATTPNARNYAAGALNLKSVDEFLTRELYFVAYGMSPCLAGTYELDMEVLKAWGFLTIFSTNPILEEFPTDGKVVRISSNLAYEAAGSTAHHPKGAVAVKENAPGEKTKLLDVVWQVGKSGAVSPVAVLEPVVIGGAIVTRASLANIGNIRKLELELGCDVAVIRAGDIIPQVVARV